MPRAILILVVLGMAVSSRARAQAVVPVEAVWLEGAGWLYVVERDGGRLTRLDPERGEVMERVELGVRPVSLVAGEGGRLIVGGSEGELVVVGRGGRVELRLEGVVKGPAEVVSLGTGRVALAGRWGREVKVVALDDGGVISRHALPFWPGVMLKRPGGRLLVANATGGSVADVDLNEEASPAEPTVCELGGVNLLGMAISGDGRELLVGHMAQPGTAPLTRTNMDWGVIYSSKLSAVRLNEFDRRADAKESRLLHYRRLNLDGSGHGAADPADLAVTPDGLTVLIALAGANQVMKVDRSLGASTAADLPPLGDSQLLDVVEVGRQPRSLAMEPGGQRVAVVEAMSDTVTILEVETLEKLKVIKLGPGEAGATSSQRGEALFHDGRLSMDRWMSCSSCHTGGHTNGLNFDTMGDGSHGAAKNTPSLLGVGSTAPYGWTGRFESLEQVVRESAKSSLHGRGLNDQAVTDLAVFLKGLPAVETKPEGVKQQADEVFRGQECASCHRPPTYTMSGTRDVGLPDRAGNRRFNPPSLLGVSRTAPYLHDGSAASLDEVLRDHHPGQNQAPDAATRAALVRFLESL